MRDTEKTAIVLGSIYAAVLAFFGIRYLISFHKQRKAALSNLHEVERFLDSIYLKEDDMDYHLVATICRNVFTLFTIYCWNNFKTEKLIRSKVECSYRIGNYRIVKVDDDFDATNFSIFLNGRYLFSVYQGTNTSWKWALHTHIPTAYSSPEYIDDKKKLYEIYKLLMLVEHECETERERRLAS